ncbi:hypothetical protein ACJX0J_011851, partial [Zea mays]
EKMGETKKNSSTQILVVSGEKWVDDWGEVIKMEGEKRGVMVVPRIYIFVGMQATLQPAGVQEEASASIGGDLEIGICIAFPGGGNAEKPKEFIIFSHKTDKSQRVDCLSPQARGGAEMAVTAVGTNSVLCGMGHSVAFSL